MITLIIQSRHSAESTRLKPASDTVTVAAGGDWVNLPPETAGSGRGFDRIRSIFGGADLGVVTLEEALLERAPSAPPQRAPWIHGTAAEGSALRDSGVGLVSLANNHLYDFGPDAAQQTLKILDEAKVLHAGWGADVSVAGAPTLAKENGHTIAVIAITTSSQSEWRATPPQGDIAGRPGVNILRFSPEITLDSQSFATLAKSPLATKLPAREGRPQIQVSNTVIQEGKNTSIRFKANPEDVERNLRQVSKAHSEAEAVVVMLHSHEPGNQYQAPEPFVEQFARQIIDAGADVVIGSGPHQLRGIERHGAGIIFYSLGNFAFDYPEDNDFVVDAYESGIDLNQLAAGVLGNVRRLPVPSFKEDIWWEGVIAVIVVRHGVQSVRILPIDLGTESPRSKRGVPHLAAGAQAREIIDRLVALSRPYGTRISVDDGGGSALIRFDVAPGG